MSNERKPNRRQFLRGLIAVPLSVAAVNLNVPAAAPVVTQSARQIAKAHSLASRFGCKIKLYPYQRDTLRYFMQTRNCAELEARVFSYVGSTIHKTLDNLEG